MQNESKKRILYVITKSNWGGAQRYVFELATAMQDRGHTVAVAAGGSGELIDRLKEAEIETFTIADLKRDISLRDEWESCLALKKIISDWKPDIMHLNSSKAGGLGSLIGRLCGVPQIIFTAHGWAYLEPRNMLWRAAIFALSYLTALLSHTVIMVSKNDLKRAPMFFLKERSVVIPTAVPLFELFPRDDARNILFTDEEPSKQARDVWVVSIAELTQNKNLETAIRAVAAFNRTEQQQIFYTIIGDGELRETLTALIQEEGAESHIRLLGNVENARAYLNAFDILVLPSRKEGMPYVILEAGIANLPVIASRVGGIPEVIEDGKTGILIEPHNHATIMEALKTLIVDTELRTTVADALHTRIRTEHGLVTMIEKTEKIYLEQ